MRSGAEQHMKRTRCCFNAEVVQEVLLTLVICCYAGGTVAFMRRVEYVRARHSLVGHMSHGVLGKKGCKANVRAATKRAADYGRLMF